jgi:hypothetical protein
MNIAFTIPKWLLWVIGLPVGLVLLFLAAMGVLFIIELGYSSKSFKRWFGW